MIIFCNIWNEIRSNSDEQRQKQKQAKRRITEAPEIRWWINLETRKIIDKFEGKKNRQQRKQEKGGGVENPDEVTYSMPYRGLQSSSSIFSNRQRSKEAKKTCNRKRKYHKNQTQQFKTLFYFSSNGSTVLDVQLRCFQPNQEEFVVETEQRIHKN